MTWEELSPEQKHDLKENYMVRLADEGRFIETIYGESADEPERGPSLGELHDADELISDEEMAAAYAGTEFVSEDFPCSSPSEQWRFTPEFVKGWAEQQLSMPRYEAEKDCRHTNCDIRAGIDYARGKLVSMCERFFKGQLTDDERKLMEDDKEKK